MRLTVEFSGGLELLFGGAKEAAVDVPTAADGQARQPPPPLVACCRRQEPAGRPSLPQQRSSHSSPLPFSARP